MIHYYTRFHSRRGDFWGQNKVRTGPCNKNKNKNKIKTTWWLHGYKETVDDGCCSDVGEKNTRKEQRQSVGLVF